MHERVLTYTFRQTTPLDSEVPPSRVRLWSSFHELLQPIRTP